MEKKRIRTLRLGSSPRRRALGLILLGAALVIWCGVIFAFSAQNAVESDATSEVYSDAIIQVSYALFGDRLSEAQMELFQKWASFLVRKLAHFSVYTVLGTLSCLFVSFLPGGGSRFLLSWLCCVLYACSDELHQSFVPGRSCQPTDVAIDSGGALFGLLLVFAVMALILRRAEKHRADLAEKTSLEKEKTI